MSNAAYRIYPQLVQDDAHLGAGGNKVSKLPYSEKAGLQIKIQNPRGVYKELIQIGKFVDDRTIDFSDLEVRKVAAQMRRPLHETYSDLVVSTQQSFVGSVVEAALADRQRSVDLAEHDRRSLAALPWVILCFDLVSYALLGAVFAAFFALWGSFSGQIDRAPVFLLSCLIFASLAFSMLSRASKHLRRVVKSNS